MAEGTIKEYLNKNISLETLKIVNKILKINNLKGISKFARVRRLEALNEALNFPTGPDQNYRKTTILYELKNYAIAIAKPGKEAAPEYKNCTHYITREKTNNPNDMNPLILENNKKIDKDLTFEDMFQKIELLKHSDLFGLELLGMLLYRAAFMLDHIKDTNGNWRYNPPIEILKILENRIPNVSGVPLRVFIHFLEILSLNEDIKIYTLGRNELKEDYGRINTLLTFVHLIAVLIERTSIAKFAGSFARPPVGMAPIPKTKIFESFPLLDPDFFDISTQGTLLKD
ncbi:MAG: hypothetical protein Q8N99_02420 [Nanoarchaeota archaeon]|nr:hypothetical protein [Nanoarchaeota archaeon]